MNPLSAETLKAYSLQLAQRINLRLGLLLMTVFTVFLSFSIYVKYDFQMRKSVASQSNNFAFWLQVNDVFQIQRALAELVAFQNLDAAQVVDRFGKRVAIFPSEAESTFPQKDQSRLKVARKNFGFLWSFPLFEGGEHHRERLGTLFILVPIPVVEILIVVLIFVALLSVLLRWIRASMINLAKEATDPIFLLSSRVESATSLADLVAHPITQSSFREIDVLETRLSDMATRITENERIVRQVERAQELFRVSSQVAHDIRSPVTALRMVAQVTQNLPSANRDLILNAADRIEKIATDLLQKHKSQMAKSSSTDEGFNIVQSCLRIVEEQKVLIEKARIDFKVTIDTENLNSRVGSAHLFERVLSNLINNAVESVSGNGSVTLHLSKRAGEAVVTISDSGEGMDPEFIQKVKSGPVLSRKKNGTGLGLYASIQTITSWNGRFDIESKNGKGTIIEIGLPLIG